MKTWVKILIVLGSLFFLFLLLFWWGNGTYNKAIALQEDVKASFSNVQSSYQRRADLIPNLVETVKGYAAHESSTLEGVVAARAKATQITIDPEKLTPEKLQQFQAAQGELSSALGKLLMIQENYPDLKANQNFLDLQAQLEGTENRINFARDQFNEKVKNYNTYVRGVVKKFWLGKFGDDGEFDKMEGFKAQQGAENAPNVKF